MTRILREIVDLEESAVKSFFEHRGNHINPAHPITSVIYQDDNPELAMRRDAHEKQRALPLLGLTSTSRVLDVGCGIGRWADALSDVVEHYHGIDFSESLIEAAKARHRSSNCSFQVASAQSISAESLPTAIGFTHILVAGVFIYLNDSDLDQTLRAIPGYCTESATIYIREPVAKETRLTLKNFYSAELASSYNAIYRTEAELLAAFSKHLTPNGFHVRLSEQLYPDDMNNRSETLQKIFLIGRS